MFLRELTVGQDTFESQIEILAVVVIHESRDIVHRDEIESIEQWFQIVVRFRLLNRHVTYRLASLHLDMPNTLPLVDSVRDRNRIRIQQRTGRDIEQKLKGFAFGGSEGVVKRVCLTAEWRLSPVRRI